MSSDQPLYVETEKGVARIVLDHSQTINALSENMLSALQDHLNEIAQDRSIKAVIIRSSGKHFCAGHNLKEMSAHRTDDDGGHNYFIHLFETCATMMQTIVKMPQPVIAEVKGIATAAGCQLVATCDLAIAADNARFATSGVNIGLFCSTPMVALTRNIARKHAMEMLLLGEFLPAQRAAEMGLINRVVPEDQLAAATMHMAQMIADKSSAAIKVGKEAFYKQAAMPLDEAYRYTGKVMADNMMAQDAEAGIGAFISKQPMPSWKGE